MPWGKKEPKPILLPARAHAPLVRCRVQLLGRAAPTETRDGVAAMQKPLHELYQDYTPVESVLTAYTSGLVLRTPASVDEGAEELWFPIQDMVECGAMRAIGKDPPTSFLPLSTEEAKSGKRPPLFAFVFKRRDIPVSDCWAVECKSDDAALALLNACMMSHKNQDGWASANDRPPPTFVKKQIAARAPPSEEWDGAVAKEEGQWNDKIPLDYYEKPSLQGFFYTPTAGLIQHYAITEMMPISEEANVPGNGKPAMEEMQQPVPQPLMPMDGICGYPDDQSISPPDDQSEISPEEVDKYGFPIGSMGTFIPENMIYPNNGSCWNYDNSIDADDRHGKKHKKHKKKSKKSKHKQEVQSGVVTNYNYYADDNRIIVPQEATAVYRAPSDFGEKQFESCLPQEYDPAWQYNMKSYMREQEHHVSGYTGPFGRPQYESHIDKLPPADYDCKKSYGDEGPYERRLPVTGCQAQQADPKMLNRNFIIRHKEDHKRRL